MRVGLSCKLMYTSSCDSYVWRSKVMENWPFCKNITFGTDWKTCYKAYALTSNRWEKGRSKDFKMVPMRGHKNYISDFDFYRRKLVTASADFTYCSKFLFMLVLSYGG